MLAWPTWSLEEEAREESESEREEQMREEIDRASEMAIESEALEI